MKMTQWAISHPPRVRWYDARARTALRRVASWLNVPWPTVVNFEHLLAYQLLLPSGVTSKLFSLANHCHSVPQVSK